MQKILLKRAYDKPSESDGTRILVDGMWPRGVSKQDARVDIWLKELAPSKELRKWFGHDPDKWKEFQSRYFQELQARPEAVNTIIDQTRKGPVTLVYAAKDSEHNNAMALKKYIQFQASGKEQ
ncbi:MAG: DUF488 domain-containing protein [Desulfovermiculus sp.]